MCASLQPGVSVLCVSTWDQSFHFNVSQLVTKCITMMCDPPIEVEKNFKSEGPAYQVNNCFMAVTVITGCQHINYITFDVLKGVQFISSDRKQ